jgi:hypothetical protein
MSRLSGGYAVELSSPANLATVIRQLANCFVIFKKISRFPLIVIFSHWIYNELYSLTIEIALGGEYGD